MIISSHAQTYTLLALTLIIASRAQNLRTEWDISTTNLTVKSDSNDVGASFIGFIVGPIMFVLSFVIVWYNQKRAAINTTRYNKINQLLDNPNIIKQNVEPLSLQQINQKLITGTNNNKIIHISGKVNILQPAYDPISKLIAQNSIKLQRQVQVRQYRKLTNKKQDPPQLGWYNYHVHQIQGRINDQSNWFIKSQIYTSSNSQIQSYKMNQKQMKSLMTNKKILPTPQNAKNIMNQTNRINVQYIIQGQYIYFPSLPGQKLSHGTLRVKYSSYVPDMLSIIASYNDNKILQPFRIDYYQNKGKQDTLCCTGNSCCCACNALGQLLKPISQIDIVLQGKKTKNQMIQTMLKLNKLQTNILRILAYALMVFGIYAFFSPIVNILGYIPLVGGFLKGVAGGLIFLGAVIVCVPLFLITFSFAWLIYHPKVGIIFVVLALGMIGVIIALDQVYGNKG